MMVRRIAIYAVALFAAASLQGTIASHIVLFRARPDLILTVVLVGSLLASAEGGMILGFTGGLVQGALVGMSQASFIISRTIPGYLAGLSEARIFRQNLLVPPIAVLVGTMLAESAFLLFDPPQEIVPQLRVIGIESVMNALIAPFVYLLLSRFLKTKR